MTVVTAATATCPERRRPRPSGLRFLPSFAFCLIAACDRPSSSPSEINDERAVAMAVAVDPPTAPGAASPNLVATPDGAMLTWIEPVNAASSAHRLRYSRLGITGWSTPTTITEGSALVANWADVPSVVRQADGVLVAHWAEKTSVPAARGYDVVLGRSTDGGTTWNRIGLANRDGTDSEHGFVSLVADGEATLALWLDGRATATEGGATSLRAARVAETVGRDFVVDDRVCDCCATSAVATARGPVVVYRDRTADELRDPWAVRRVGGVWSAPAPVHVDGWRVTGCPVNGPAVDASGQVVAAAWYTAAAPGPRIQVAFSTDAGAAFEPPIEVDAPRATSSPMGRVDLVLDAGGGAVVSWLVSGRDGVHLLARRVARDRRRGSSVQLASLPAAPDVGFPRIARVGADLLFCWTDPRAHAVRVSRLPANAVPGTSATAPVSRVRRPPPP